ncbi:TPA: hypothetical protein R1891_004468 [Klebsiella oxytoca]|uniref:hypothetical protein n=1 Tax=Klebsiella TaxID=570 RepID=UPI000E03F25F|nr:hypothetical protein [Klebsiella oxytoca]STR52684.1 Uncharacterised protein [Klebsiella oxytoca]HEC2105586.1 hypothetical protein [Klebsiella oxytoca]HEJ9371994.1 hypothetical protein [Klebsiella oxytoca]
MSRIPVTLNQPAIRQTIKNTAKRNNCTESSVLSSCVIACAPFLEKMNADHQSILNLQGTLQKAILKETISQYRSERQIYPELYFSLAFETCIKDQTLITPAGSHQQKAINDGMSKTEKETIKAQMEVLLESSNAKKIIYIYHARYVDPKTLFTYGQANIIPIKEVVYEGNAFDFDNIQVMPTSYLIAVGINELLKMKGIFLPHPCICWVSICHINNFSVMLPVVREVDISVNSKASGDVIIINPFSRKLSQI